MPTKVKEMIEEIINTKGIIKPKKIYIKLHEDPYHSKLPCKVDKKQIINYLYYRNKSTHGSNDEDELVNHLQGLNYWDRLDDDEMFIFGTKYGTGDDYDHFRVCFTSIQ